MNKTTSSVFNVNVNGTAAQNRCLCVSEVLLVNRDQLQVCVKCLTPTKIPKPILHIPNAEYSVGERFFISRSLFSVFLAESQGKEMNVDNFRKHYQQRSCPLSTEFFRGSF